MPDIYLVFFYFAVPLAVGFVVSRLVNWPFWVPDIITKGLWLALIFFCGRQIMAGTTPDNLLYQLWQLTVPVQLIIAAAAILLPLIRSVAANKARN